MGWLRSLTAALRRRDEPVDDVAAVPTSAELLAAVDAIGPEIAGRVPAIVQARVDRIVGVVRDTIPRLDSLGAGSRDAHSVMATATSYLPEALEAYLRLPRSFADRRPVDRGRTSLMVLVDQLDLLASSMDSIYDAVYRQDAQALVAHGAFLAEKFGASSLTLDAGAVVPPAPGSSGPASGAPGAAAEPGRLAPPGAV